MLPAEDSMGKRLACVRAYEARECGPAALATVARHYGLDVSVAVLAETLCTDMQGTELTALKGGAEELGFLAATGQARDGSLDRIPLPAIAHFSDTPRGHFVTIHSVAPDRITVADPARGIVTLSRDEFLKRWSRSLLLLSPSPLLRPGRSRPRPLAEILRQATPHRRVLVGSLACAMAMTGLGLGMSWFLQVVVDRILPRHDWQLLHILTAGMFVVLALQALSGLARQHLLALVGHRVEVRAGLDYVSHVLALRLSAIERRCTGDVVARLADVDAISRAITTTLLTIGVDALLLACATLFMVAYHPRLALTVLAFMPAAAAVSLLLQRPLVASQRRIREQTSLAYNQLFEAAAGIRAIKAFTAEAQTCRRFEHLFVALKDSLQHRNRLASLVGAITALLTAAASVLLVWAGAGSVAAGGLSIGGLLFFYALVAYVLGPVDRLAGSWPALQEALVGMERLSEIQGLEREDADAQARSPLETVKGDVELQDVSFWYRKGWPVLSNVSLRVPAGATLVILGETGSGKTSLAHLLLGLHDPTSGVIRIDGRDSRDLEKASLRRFLSIVFQDPTLLSGSVRENIALGVPEAPLTLVQEAARLAAADEFILGLPKQYDYDVGDRGQALSGGQRQRIAIARALFRRPAVLILDEATSNLDLDTERRVMDSLRAARRQLTTIIITHRPSIVRAEDIVVVLENGRVVSDRLPGGLGSRAPSNRVASEEPVA
jgi:ABC-type bacteriocin/lantibiotic exporter with double-glycine peptidase domain